MYLMLLAIAGYDFCRFIPFPFPDIDATGITFCYSVLSRPLGNIY